MRAVLELKRNGIQGTLKEVEMFIHTSGVPLSIGVCDLEQVESSSSHRSHSSGASGAARSAVRCALPRCVSGRPQKVQRDSVRGCVYHVSSLCYGKSKDFSCFVSHSIAHRGQDTLNVCV